VTVTKDVAMKVWNDVFGNALWALDCFGFWMYKEDYGDSNRTRNNRPNGTGKFFHYGWTIDHIRPKSDFSNETESNFYNNFEPMQISNNLKKSDNYPNFEINETRYQVVKCEICERNGVLGYGIKNVHTDKRIDWKATQNKYYG